jgi:hypothetical protein
LQYPDEVAGHPAAEQAEHLDYVLGANDVGVAVDQQGWIERRAAGEREAVDQLRTIEGQLKSDTSICRSAICWKGSCSTPSSRRRPSTRTRSMGSS